MTVMATMGIRELRDHLSDAIRRVTAGEVIDVTDHGRPVARIVPARPQSVFDRLVAEGRATEAEGNLLDLEPLPPIPGAPPLSEVVIAMREEDDR